MTELSNFSPHALKGQKLLGASALSGRAASRTLVLYLSYSFMFESTKQKGRRSLMLSKQ